MRRHPHRILAGLAVVAGLLAALFTVAPASPASAATNALAPGDVTTLFEKFYGFPTETNPGVSVTGVLACPAGQRVVGVGAGNGTVSALAPVQNFTAVKVVGAVTWPSPTFGGNFIQVRLLCAPADRFTDVKTVRVVDHRAKNQHGPGGNYLRDVASCPAGYYAFGGGGYFSNTTGSAESGFQGAYWITGNGPTPDGNGWAFTAQAWTDSQSMVVVAQCAPRTGREFLAQTISPVVPAGGSYESRSGYAHCPSGYTPVAGGWYLATPDGKQAFPTTAQNYIGTAFWTTAADDAGLLAWYATAAVQGGNELIVLAQCLRA